MTQPDAVDVWRHRTPDWARRTARVWLGAGIAVYAVRLIAYLALDEQGWLFVDSVMSEGGAWICFVVAAWRRGFLAGWERGRP